MKLGRHTDCFKRQIRKSTRFMNLLVVRLRHLHPPDTGLGANVGVKRTTGRLLILVELLNLTFDLEPDVSGTQMSNSLH
ncbi:hypothetical protein CHELA40_14869 [Chelatococcus asaccharovorans]|nr:hypothetical protein CHELA17_60753 [Chelatococcus asaccharovorans]CAH1680459.1 hypothetical protein CHELA40_14869 [Chelatococcus asaccharovorans]